MNILVTGARAPISADIVRALSALGHKVWTSDSMFCPVGRFSPFSKGYVRLPAPRTDFGAFQQGLIAACRKLSIQYIIPTSEEVFWLSAVQGLPAGCSGFYPNLEQLGQLHNKHTFAALAERLGYGAAENHVLRDQASLDNFLKHARIEEYVLKPVYSRFASEVLVSPSREEAEKVLPTADTPWLAQTRARGTEVCLYNIASEGKLLMHTAYLPKWRAGKGAGVYFEPAHQDVLRELAAAFVHATNFTGQISFDVIVTAAGLVALECNPRGTSGAHLAAQNLEQFGAALMGEPTSAASASAHPVMLALPHLLYNTAAVLGEGRAAWARAGDAMKAAGVPLLGQLAATLELLMNTIGTGKTAIEVSTADIEWNGELIF
jgi:NAD(P)-dependent dehydrogenase (short-subunit alcohol dehydrogenase family)